MTTKQTCRLCDHTPLLFVCEDKRRQFYLCDNCDLISVPRQYWLNDDDERARYDLHDNTIGNDGYVKYLSQVADVVTTSFDHEHHPKIKVLDFGCGKNAVLCGILNDIGIYCCGYDPLYIRESLDRRESKGGNEHHLYTDNDIHEKNISALFDVIILCEVIEHIRDIRKESELIKKLLRDDGTIIIRTQLYENPSAFPNWWYAQDPTHVSFFNERALNVMAGMIGKRVVKTSYRDIFLLR